MENLKQKLVEGFKKEVSTMTDYKSLKKLRETLRTDNFSLICADVNKDSYVIVYKSLLSRVEYKEVLPILSEIESKFELFKVEIINSIQEEDYNNLLNI